MKRLAPARRAARARPIVGLGVDDAVVVLRNAGHRLRQPGRVDDRIHALERRRHVSRPGEVANHGACSLDWQRSRPAQQHAQAMAAFG